MAYGKIARFSGEVCGIELASGTATCIVLRSSDKLEIAYSEN
jgi:hypothetical protein